MLVLEQLWRNRLTLVLQNLDRDEQQHREIANLAEQIGADYHGRCLIELIQNANDQALEANTPDATILIVRTKELVAVFNQGAPFTDKGIRAITSLGVSPKKADIHIGNKGIGFKAVFQVTDAPEIYSVGDRGGSLAKLPETRFQLDREVLRRSTTRLELERLIRGCLEEDQILSKRLRQRFGSGLMDRILQEVQFCAPFKFPRPLETRHFEDRIRSLGVSSHDLANYQTLVLLPLLVGEQARKVVKRVFSELNEAHGGHLLFLTGISRLRLVDRTTGLDRDLERRTVGKEESLEGDRRFRQVEILDHSSSQKRNPPRRWWLVSRILGRSGARALEEQQEIAAAVSSLPGEGWQNMRSAPVSVALSCPPDEDNGPLEPSGMLCIGLPTLDRTGVPFWVDAHFHGTISRTNIDLEDTPYNHLLFDAAVSLVASLVERLKRDPDIRVRRIVTRAMTRSEGPVAKVLHGASGLARSAIVLAESGSRWLRPGDVRLAAEKDSAVFSTIRLGGASSTEVREAGFVLPDVRLLEEASVRKLIRELGAKDMPPATFLKPLQDGRSLLERAAASLRHAEPKAWDKLLNWCIDRFKVEQLEQQRILPIGDDALASPRERVFLRPISSIYVQDDIPELAELPAAVIEALHFLDERVVQVRSGGWLNGLGQQLAPEQGNGLVHRARKLELIADVLSPRQREAASTASEQPLAWQLLCLGLRWVEGLTQSQQEKLPASPFMVPLAGGKGRWGEPETLYFGKGWMSPDEETLLQVAFGRSAHRLVSWHEFMAGACPEEKEREVWSSRLQVIGVNASPRVLSVNLSPDMTELPTAAHLSDLVRQLLEQCSVAPATERQTWMENHLQNYLQSLLMARQQTWSSKSVSTVYWIDGLERPDVREAVTKLIFQDVSSYVGVSGLELGYNSSFPAFWAQVWHTEGWPYVPVHPGSPLLDARLASGARLWLLDRRERDNEALALLPVPELPDGRPEGSFTLLEALGACRLKDASVSRAIAVLHDLAAALEALSYNQRDAAEALAELLYRQLDQAVGTSRASTTSMLEKPLPLWRGPQLCAVSLSAERRLYVEDEPYRARFIPDLEQFPRLVCLPEQPLTHITGALEQLLGQDVVLRTSRAPIDIGFTAARSPSLLFTWLEAEAGYPDIIVDLACVLLYGLPEKRLNLQSREFLERWESLQTLQVIGGMFRADHAAFYDHASHTLQLDRALEPVAILAELWPVVGQPWRDLLSSFTYAIQFGARDRFLLERQINRSRREDVRAWLKTTQLGITRRFKAVLLALWRRTHPRQHISTFIHTLASRSTPAEVARLLGPTQLVEYLEEAAARPPGEGVFPPRPKVPQRAFRSQIPCHEGVGSGKTGRPRLLMGGWGMWKMEPGRSCPTAGPPSTTGWVVRYGLWCSRSRPPFTA